MKKHFSQTQVLSLCFSLIIRKRLLLWRWWWCLFPRYDSTFLHKQLIVPGGRQERRETLSPLQGAQEYLPRSPWDSCTWSVTLPTLPVIGMTQQMFQSNNATEIENRLSGNGVVAWNLQNLFYNLLGTLTYIITCISQNNPGSIVIIKPAQQASCSCLVVSYS